MRREFQRVMEDELVAMVEAETGRKVRAFMSDNHVSPDVAVEVFLLEPLDPGNGDQAPASVETIAS
jgi:hypothetical protein